MRDADADANKTSGKLSSVFGRTLVEVSQSKVRSIN